MKIFLTVSHLGVLICKRSFNQFTVSENIVILIIIFMYYLENFITSGVEIEDYLGSSRIRTQNLYYFFM